MNESIWKKSIKGKEVRSHELNGDIKTDVLIIGGGIAGVLCARALNDAGVDCVLLEKGRILEGVTANTTAKITFLHGLVYDKIIKRYGKENAALYLRANREALEKYAHLCEKIDCNFERKDAYVYSLNDREKIENEVNALNLLGVNAELISDTELPFSVSGAVRVGGQAQFNPLKFLHHIAKGLKIYENTKVTELKKNVATTKNGKVTSEKIVVATHFPFLNKHGGYFIKMFQHRSYVVALQGAPKIDGMYVDESDKGLSLRQYGDTLLLGGGGHKTGKKGGGWRELEELARKYYPNAKIKARWATQDCITLDSIPYIGQYSKSTPNLFVATGFNKWGMTSSMVASTILCDLVQGKANGFSEVFSPSRTILHPMLAKNAMDSVLGLITPTAPRCPHLGCALKYNREEHSWDCPCHGSRFDESGEVLNGPATDDKSFK